jgi:hypothetical protein
MIGGGNPMVKARHTARAVFVLLQERDNVTGLLYQAYVGNVESYVFDSRDISYDAMSGCGGKGRRGEEISKCYEFNLDKNLLHTVKILLTHIFCL